ncbi:MAG: hypothetical protein U0V74_01745 [Chitinophagales bacterium]
MNKLKVLVIILIVGAIAMLSACKQGCTDAKAMNFNASAKEDDGSCMYCDSSSQLLSNAQTYIYDGQQGSPYQFSYVMAIEDRFSEVSYNGNGCRAIGVVNDPNCRQGRNYLVLYNLVPTDIHITFDLTVTVSSSFGFNTVNTYSFTNISVPASDSLVLGSVGNNCLDQGTFFSVGINSSNHTINYQ